MITVIIPTLNDARTLPRTLAPLVDAVADGLVKQVIIADGGSTDDTVAVAEAAGCDVVTSEQGRGKQCRAAIPIAKGKYLFFLNPDTVLRPGWMEEVEGFCAGVQSRSRAAVFKLALDDDSPAAKRTLFWARLRASAMKLPYAEQGLLLSRFFYDGLGGYPEMRGMEDVELARRIGAKRWTWFDTEAITSSPRFRQSGQNRSALRNLSVMARYWLGGDPIELAKAYD